MRQSGTGESFPPTPRHPWTHYRQHGRLEYELPQTQNLALPAAQARLTLNGFHRAILGLIKGRVADSTLALYTTSLTSFIRIIGNIPLHTLTPYHFESYTSRRLERVSATRANIEFRALRAMFSRAVLLRMLPSHPMVGLRQVRLPHRETRILSRKELLCLLRAIDRREFRALVIVAVCTAMRAGEIASLRWDDVDLCHGVIHLKSREGFCPKNGRGRDVPLSRRAVLALKSLPRVSVRVFLKRRGNPYTSHSLSVWFKRYVRRARLSEEIHFHSLRHTAASMMVAKNVPVPFVREVLGHSSITTTMRYAHICPRELQRVLWRIDPVTSTW